MPRLPARVSLLRRRVHLFTRLLHRVEEGDVHAIHQTRVASRRLREVLPVMPLDPSESRRLSRRLRQVTSALGKVRELDVLGAVLDELQQSCRFDVTGIEQVRAALSDERATARSEASSELPSDVLHRLATRLERLLAAAEEAATDRSKSTQWARPLEWATDARIVRRANALVEAMDAAGAVYLAERLHRVRIAAKKLRYAVELAADSGDARRRAELPLFKRAQDLLGRMHDLQVLVDRVRGVQASLTPPDARTERALEALVATTEDECRVLHARYVALAPALRAACARLRPKNTASRPRQLRRAG
jgi:CHAD domain-containing protein